MPQPKRIEQVTPNNKTPAYTNATSPTQTKLYASSEMIAKYPSKQSSELKLTVIGQGKHKPAQNRLPMKIVESFNETSKFRSISSTKKTVTAKNTI